MNPLTIGQVAKRTGLAASAIRYYESEGLLLKAARHNGRRIFDADVVQRLALIALVKNAGFTISETRALLDGFSRKHPPGKRWRALAGRKITEIDERIAEAQRMKRLLALIMRCECPTFEVCSEALATQGCCP